MSRYSYYILCPSLTAMLSTIAHSLACNERDIYDRSTADLIPILALIGIIFPIIFASPMPNPECRHLHFVWP